jgi:hypothetical protein
MATYTGVGQTGWWENGQPVAAPPGAPIQHSGSPTGWLNPQTGLPAQPPQPNQSFGGGGNGAFSPETNAYLNQQEQEKAKNKAMMEAQGYTLEAHPYQFDPSKFTNPYYSQDKGMLDQMLATYQNQKGPQISGDLKNLYMNQAKGIGPSIAEASYNKAKNEGISNILAMNASSRGGNRGASNRAAMYNVGNLGVQGAQDVALAKMQESEAGKQGWLGIEKTQGQFDLANQDQKNQMVQYFVSQGLSLNQAQWAAGIKLQEMQAEQHAGAQQTLAGINAAKAGKPSFGDMLAGGLINAAAAAPFLIKKGPGQTNQSSYQPTWT